MPPAGTGWALSAGRRLVLGEQRDPVPHIARQLGASDDRDHPVIRVIKCGGISPEPRIDVLAVMLIATMVHHVAVPEHGKSESGGQSGAVAGEPTRTGQRYACCLSNVEAEVGGVRRMGRQPAQLVEQQRALGRCLTTFREAAGLFQADIARSVPCHRTTVTHAEAGSQLPDSHFWETADRVVGANGVLLATYDSLIQAKESHKADQIAVRRARARAMTQEMDAARSSQERGVRNLASRPLADARQLTSQLDDIAQRYETLPSASLLAEAGQCHASIALLLRYAQSEPMRRELHTAATASAILMSQLVWDVSGRRDYTTTVAYCDEAIAHGRECSDAIAVAHAELRKGFAALYGRATMRNSRVGLNFAQAAAEHSRGESDALRGLSLLHVGEAYAMLGERRQCEWALGAAEASFGQIDRDDPGANFYSPTQFGRLAGSCYLFLGHPEQAEPLLDATAKALHARPKTRSLVLGNLALAYLRQRQMEAATATLHDAIDLLEGTCGGGGLTVVFGVGRELYPWRNEQAVHDIQDRLLALVART
jgi:Helix-turn-helix domain